MTSTVQLWSELYAIVGRPSRENPRTARSRVRTLQTLQQRSGLPKVGQVETLGGQTLEIAAGTITAGDGTTASITTPDQAVTNGFVQGITGLLFVPTPPTTAPTAPPTQPPGS